MGIERIAVGRDDPTGPASTNAYLLGTEAAVLVDPGGASAALDDALDRIEHVVATHHHDDHVSALARYAERAGATVWARAGRVDAFADAAGVAPDRTFREGTEIPTDDGPVTVLGTPGHAPEHVGFVHPDGTVCGDLAVADGSVAVAAPEGDMRAYLSSLRRIHARNPPRLLPGHGPPIADVRETCRRLVDHRLARERRVLAAVRDGAGTIPDIRDAAYDKDLTGVADLAAATVQAHVEKLAVEGAVVVDGERVSLA